MPDAGALLAEVDNLKEQAERVRDLIGFGGGEPGNAAALGADHGRVVAGADGFCELPDLFDMIEDAVTGLLADDRAQPRGEESDFFFELRVHASWRGL